MTSSYEDVPYPSDPIYESHPDRLATAARLVGLTPAPVERCRVLELGCASGGNLVTMAATLPESRFIGVDLAPSQIAAAREMATALDVRNVELRAMSLTDLGEEIGQFDYILCHGVYSWVTPRVQEKILELFARHLAPSGVGYISYNVYPGWHKKGLVREMMSYHGRRFAEPRARIQQARALLEFVSRAIPDGDTVYARILKEEAARLRPLPDDYVFHEYLEDENQPVYFHQFAAQLGRAGLQYLGESCLQTTVRDLPEHLQRRLDEMAGDRIAFEQYVDFLRNRTFRRSILCRADAVAHAPELSRVFELRVGALARPERPDVDVRGSGKESFRTAAGATLTTDVPPIKALLV
jgi:SAM-dependent methyltransferase